jgi:hypothetical protein
VTPGTYTLITGGEGITVTPNPDFQPNQKLASNFGAVGNANYQNPGNLKWYVDAGLTIEATDDSAAIAATFASASAAALLGASTTVVLTGNHYIKTPQLSNYGGLHQAAFFVVPNGCTVEGFGTAWLRLGPGLNAMGAPNTGGWAMLASASNLSDVTIHGVNFDGNGQSGAPVNQANSFISFLGNATNNLVIEDCQFFNWSGWNAVIVTAVGSGDSGFNVRVANNIFEEMGNSATLTDHVQLYLQATGVAIVNNLFVNAIADAAVVRNFGNTIQLQAVDATVTGNVFYNQSNAFLLGSYFSAPNFQSSNVSITGNTFDLVVGAIQFAQAVGLTLSDIAITGNTFSCVDAAIGQPSYAVGLLAVNGSNGLGVNRLTICDNTMLYANTGLSSASGSAIYMNGVVTSCLVANNSLEGWPSNGIAFEPTAASNGNPPTGVVATSDLKIYDLTICGNSLKNSGGTALAIAVSCDTTAMACQRVRIRDNIISSTGSAIAVGIAAVVAGDHLTIVGNETQNVTLPYEYSSANGITNVVAYGTLGDNGTTLALGLVGHTVTFTGQPQLADGQYLASENANSTGQIFMLGLDGSNNVRLGPNGNTAVVVGAISSSSSVANGDLVMQHGNSLRFSSAINAAHRAVGFDGTNVVLAQDGDPIELGQTLGAATGGSGVTFSGAGIGLTGNPQTATQNGWCKFLDSAGNPFWLPAWR